MEETLLGRMLPYIANCAAVIARGRHDGLCYATADASNDDAIGAAELRRLKFHVRKYVSANHCGYVLMHLTPDRRRYRDQDTCVLAAERWREWAISLVRDVQRELYGY